MKKSFYLMLAILLCMGGLICGCNGLSTQEDENTKAPFTAPPKEIEPQPTLEILDAVSDILDAADHSALVLQPQYAFCSNVSGTPGIEDEYYILSSAEELQNYCTSAGAIYDLNLKTPQADGKVLSFNDMAQSYMDDTYFAERMLIVMVVNGSETEPAKQIDTVTTENEQLDVTFRINSAAAEGDTAVRWHLVVEAPRVNLKNAVPLNTSFPVRNDGVIPVPGPVTPEKVDG